MKHKASIESVFLDPELKKWGRKIVCSRSHSLTSNFSTSFKVLYGDRIRQYLNIIFNILYCQMKDKASIEVFLDPNFQKKRRKLFLVDAWLGLTKPTHMFLLKQIDWLWSTQSDPDVISKSKLIYLYMKKIILILINEYI